jgi:hypothetical protein
VERSRADEYRRAAADCRELAERALNQADKERWLKIAEQWLELVRRAENPDF